MMKNKKMLMERRSYLNVCVLMDVCVFDQVMAGKAARMYVIAVPDPRLDPQPFLDAADQVGKHIYGWRSPDRDTERKAGYY